MAKQIITTGNSANDGSGDPARTAFTKTNNNFNEIYEALGGNTLPNALPINKGGTGATNAETVRTNLGLGTAATANVGSASGNVMRVGDWGLGATIGDITLTNDNIDAAKTQLASWYQTWFALHFSGFDFNSLGKPNWSQLLVTRNAANGGLLVRSTYNGLVVNTTIYGSNNTTVDANGFLKRASPIINLYANSIELNIEAQEQDIQFERVDVGHYLIKNSSGLSNDGWYIEQPKDANGNLYHVVEYQTLENGDIEIKTFDYMLDKRGRIVADHDTPLDIQDSRFISIRLNELPKPEYVPDEVIPDEPQQ